MKEVEFNDPHRKKHFDFFRKMDQPHFNITANVEIGGFLDFIKKKRVAFYSGNGLLYCSYGQQYPGIPSTD